MLRKTVYIQTISSKVVQLNQQLHTEQASELTLSQAVFMQTPAIISMPDSVCTIITTINLINIISVSVDNSLSKVHTLLRSVALQASSAGVLHLCFSLKDSPWKRTGPTLPMKKKQVHVVVNDRDMQVYACRWGARSGCGWIYSSLLRHRPLCPTALKMLQVLHLKSFSSSHSGASQLTVILQFM